MRVLHVYKDVFPPIVGGIERHIHSIRLALPDVEHTVLICGRRRRTTVREPQAEGVRGNEIHVGEFGRILSTPIAPAFPLWLARASRGALVHLHMPQPVGEVSALLARGGSPLIATYHADIFRQRWMLFAYKPLIVQTLRRADAVIVASERMRDRSPLVKAAGVDPTVIPYGIDVDCWAPERAQATLVETIRRRFGSRFALAVGRLVPYKGFNYLVDAARASDLPLVIVGDGVSRIDLEQRAARLGVADKVHFVGRVSDEWLSAYLAAASMFVLSSWNRAEAFGIVLLEAQAAGLPVIATELGTGTTEAFDPGVTGLLVPPANAGALADAINRLARDPSLCESMGAAGRRRVCERNSLDALGRALRPVYAALWETVEADRRALRPLGAGQSRA
jgi:glycosyltransferase involved in cell wall biosynthesis